NDAARLRSGRLANSLQVEAQLRAVALQARCKVAVGLEIDDRPLLSALEPGLEGKVGNSFDQCPVIKAEQDRVLAMGSLRGRRSAHDRRCERAFHRNGRRLRVILTCPNYPGYIVRDAPDVAAACAEWYSEDRFVNQLPEGGAAGPTGFARRF